MTVPQPIPARPTARVPALDAGRTLRLRHADARRAWIDPGGSLPATAVREEPGPAAGRVGMDAVAANRAAGSA
jgi:hypothetical protein